MKQLLCLLLALLCLAALTTTAFADLILPPDWPGETYEFTVDLTSPTLSADDLVAARSETVPATEAPAAPQAGGTSLTVLFLVIGPVIVAAALVLFFLLRKKAK